MDEYPTVIVNFGAQVTAAENDGLGNMHSHFLILHPSFSWEKIYEKTGALQSEASAERWLKQYYRYYKQSLKDILGILIQYLPTRIVVLNSRTEDDSLAFDLARVLEVPIHSLSRSTMTLLTPP